MLHKEKRELVMEPFPCTFESIRHLHEWKMVISMAKLITFKACLHEVCLKWAGRDRFKWRGEKLFQRIGGSN